jgi:hypothetical protein
VFGHELCFSINLSSPVIQRSWYAKKSKRDHARPA